MCVHHIRKAYKYCLLNALNIVCNQFLAVPLGLRFSEGRGVHPWGDLTLLTPRPVPNKTIYNYSYPPSNMQSPFLLLHTPIWLPSLCFYSKSTYTPCMPTIFLPSHTPLPSPSSSTHPAWQVHSCSLTHSCPVLLAVHTLHAWQVHSCSLTHP